MINSLLKNGNAGYFLSVSVNKMKINYAITIINFLKVRKKKVN